MIDFNQAVRRSWALIVVIVTLCGLPHTTFAAEGQTALDLAKLAVVLKGRYYTQEQTIEITKRYLKIAKQAEPLSIPQVLASGLPTPAIKVVLLSDLLVFRPVLTSEQMCNWALWSKGNDCVECFLGLNRLFTSPRIQLRNFEVEKLSFGPSEPVTRAENSNCWLSGLTVRISISFAQRDAGLAFARSSTISVGKCLTHVVNVGADSFEVKFNDCELLEVDGKQPNMDPLSVLKDGQK